MKVDRLTRVNELLRREIGSVLFRVLDPHALDLSAVTVTRVVTSSDLRTARVLVSIRGHQDERHQMLGQLQRHRPAIQRHIAETVILKYTPRLTFVLDTSIELGDQVLDLLEHLPPPADARPTTPTPQGAEDD